MSYTIRIEPTGHSFTALPEETLLEAALRSGININYNCSNGTCGDCKARLLAGDVETSPADYRFSIQEKNEGTILLCSARAVSDLVIAAQEAHSSKDIPLQQIATKVVKIEPRGENIRIVHLRTPRTKTLRFLAGQHVALTLPNKQCIDAPVASCPCNGMQLQFHLRHQDGDPAIESLFNELQAGDMVQLEGPFGDITLDDDTRRPLLMVAVNEEFAPIKSLIEHAINLDIQEPIRLFWLAEKTTGHYLENHCRSWDEVLDDYRFFPLTTEKAAPDAAETGRLLDTIGHEMTDLSSIDIYVAGPVLFQRQLQQQLIARGADETHVRLLQRRNVRMEQLETAD